MRLLIHSQYFPPEIGAPQSRLSEIALIMSDQSIDVTILTAMPNYPTGNIFPGYGGIYRKEKKGNITIYRSLIYPSQNTSLLPRLLNYFSFAISSFFVGALISKQDIIITESPPLFLGITGFLLSRLKKSYWILNIADLWPQSAVELGIINESSLAHQISKKIETFLYKRAWVISGQSRSILKNINSRFENLTTYHLSNGVDSSKYHRTDKTSSNSSITILYAGLHGLAQGLDQIISAAKYFQTNPNIIFELIGDGPEKKKLIQFAKSLETNNIKFLNPVSKEQIPDKLLEADIIIVPLKIQLTGAVPSKLYEAMAVGKPIILIAGSEAAEIVKETNCGLVVDPGNIGGLIDAINYLVGHPEERRKMGLNGREAVMQKFDRTLIVDRFIQFIKNKWTKDEVASTIIHH